MLPPACACCWPWLRPRAGKPTGGNAKRTAGSSCLAASGCRSASWPTRPRRSRRPMPPICARRPRANSPAALPWAPPASSSGSTCRPRSMAASCSPATCACPAWSMPRSATGRSATACWPASTRPGQRGFPGWSRWSGASAGWLPSPATGGPPNARWPPLRRLFELRRAPTAPRSKSSSTRRCARARAS